MFTSEKITGMVIIAQKCYIVILIAFLCLSSVTLGQHSGELIKRNFSVAGCNVHSMTVKFKITHLMGEAIVKGTFKWQADVQTNNDCLPYDLHIWLKISDNLGNYGYIELSNDIPKAGKGFGFDVPGSPNWNQFIFNIKNSNEKAYLSAEKAKELYKKGKITDFTFSKNITQGQIKIQLSSNSEKNKTTKGMLNFKQKNTNN